MLTTVVKKARDGESGQTSNSHKPSKRQTRQAPSSRFISDVASCEMQLYSSPGNKFLRVRGAGLLEIE